MLGIGIDWAEEFHDVAFGTPEKGVVEQFRISHGPDGVGALIDRALRLEPDPAEVRVVLETPRVSQFLALSLVRGSRGHAGDAWFVDLGV